MTQYSRHQQNIIKRYYENRSSISLQRIQEMVTELYLSSGNKRQRQWKLLAAHLEKLDVPASQIEHLIEQDNPELVAKLVQQLLEKESAR